MAETTISGSVRRNNGATVVMGGAADGKTVTSVKGRTFIGYHSGVSGTAPISKTGANIGTQKCVSAGTFAFVMRSGVFVGKKLSTTLGGVTNNVLLYGSSDVGSKTRESIHYKLTDRALGVNTWNYTTGAITKGGTAGNAITFIDPATAGGVTAATDSAALASRALPGELVLTSHGMAKSGSLAVPLYADYAAKTD